MNPPSIKAMVAAVSRSLGSYGPVLDEIEAALQSPQCSLNTIGDAIQKDPDLTARLLRLANSPFFGFANRLSTVAEAVSLLGVQQIQDMIVASSVLEQFAGVPGQLVNQESFWRHSLAVGLTARWLAMERRLPKPDKFFVAGLLHDVGRLVIFSQSADWAEKVFACYASEKILLRDAEKKILGYDHQQIAAELLQSWSYPAALVQAVAFHHAPNSGVAKMDAAVVHIADHLVNAMGIGSSGEQYVSPLDEKAWAVLGLGTEILGRLVETVDEQILAVEEAFLKK
ncbi:MAG TPA: HDOD domain-containing protein [Candidatus Acidoferrales bacterium]|jgi:putative nucleotidyltransferase with HDIG domain|nr:HDOD domain-containing protein [Candidatus Acidoferrales bacterium]